ncbi:SprT-like domain-containing protein [Emticicia sp.]|uniref:SprT-like domain-containing protein n=1 Tax=Emticicia sp. TaxID=1930953 RepID=UPI003752EBCD
MSLSNFFKKVQKVIEANPAVFNLDPPTPAIVKKMQEILEKHVPETAVEYCFKLWQSQPFSFKISRTRSSCFGNYTFRDGQHKITVNHDLHHYAFLITYIHEIAHQRAWLDKSRRKIEPHGKEWKKKFQDLMTPILNLNVFPEKVLIPLSQYMQNPAASSVSYAPLFEALRSFDVKEENEVSLAELTDNQWFMFRNNVFQKLEIRRTRVLCLEKKSKKRYTILATARVKLIQ